jgi:hypothetical protein
MTRDGLLFSNILTLVQNKLSIMKHNIGDIGMDGKILAVPGGNGETEIH